MAPKKFKKFLHKYQKGNKNNFNNIMLYTIQFTKDGFSVGISLVVNDFLIV